jgi:hypothetical protein
VATVTITDTAAPIITVVATDATATENSPDAGTFTFTRTGPTTADLAVNWQPAGTATFGSDYNLSSCCQVTIPAGQASTTVTVTALADVPNDPDETVTATITAGGSPPYAIGTPSVATVTITDTAAPIITVVATDATATENSADAGTFTFTRTGPTTADLAVNWQPAGTAVFSSDYNLSSCCQVTIPAGQASTTVTVTALADVPNDPDETVTATITAGGSQPYAIGTPYTAAVTIIDTSGFDMAWDLGAIDWIAGIFAQR